LLVLNINQNSVERGSEIFWNNLSKNLVSRGIEVKILSSGSPATQNKASNLISKILRRTYLDIYSLKVLFFTLSNIRKIINYQPDIVIPTNGGWQVVGIRLIRQIGQISKCKIILIGHSGMGHDEKFNLKLGGADLFIALTKEQMSWAEKINPKIKIKHIPNGVDTNLFNSKGERYDFDLEKPIYLTVASLEKYKNIEKSIEAVSKLSKGSLVILGKGQEERPLQTLCDVKLKGRSYIGSVCHQDLPRHYRGANVFTLVSGRQEAFGLVYLEAMACGLPVVAANDAKRRNIMGEAGMFVDPNNIEEYKSSLMKASDKNWGDKPRLQAEKFSWEKIAERYFEEFKNL
jgi:glycosyltransferase involved in cell wall biosynthesis